MKVLCFFFDFQSIPDATKTYYFDDVVINYGEAPEVTASFTVDMNSYLDEVDTVFLRGSFNDWTEANPMTDNGDGTWTTSITASAGIVEYKYYVKSGDVWEEFAITDECVATSFGGGGEVFTNRSVAMVDGADFNTCWSSCYACEDRATLSFELGFPDGVEPADSVYLAGGGNFDNPGGRFLLDDSDGDGVYTISLNRSLGFTSFYTFANGPCGDYSCKEDISGLACANEDNFNDRLLDPLTGDTVVSTCFGECSEDTNCTAIEAVNVTFRVDMNESDVSDEGVFFAGEITGWQNAAMSDDDGDNVYEIVYPLETGDYEYKFKNGENGWEEFAEGDPCTTTFDDGNGSIFVNRILSVDATGDDVATTSFCFNTCNSCSVSTDDLSENNNLFAVRPSISEGQFVLEFENILDLQFSVIDINGQVQESIVPTNNTMEMDLTHLAKGMYFINAQSGKYFKTSRIIIQ